MKHSISKLALSGLLVAGLAAGSAFAQDTPQSAPAQPSAEAQGPRHHAPDPDKQLARMSKHLALSADQQTQIKPILADRQQQMQGLFQDQSLSKADRHAKMKSIHEDSNSKIEAILSDQQKQKFEAMQARMEARRGKHKHGAPETEAAPAPSAS